MPKKKIFKFCLKLLVSLAFVAWLLFKVRWGEVLAYARVLAAWQIALYLGTILAGMVISAYKWQLLARSKGLEFPLWELFKLYLAGSFINNFMPSTIGGDTYRAYSISKESGNFARGSATVVMDRLTGLLGLMLLTVVFALVNWQIIFSRPLLLLLVVGIVGILLLLFILEKLMQAPLAKRLTAKIPSSIGNFLRIIHGYYLQRKLFLGVVSLSAAFALVGVALANFILFRSLGIEVDLLNYLSVIFLISIVSALPVSINNIGIKEWAYVTFFGFFGVSVSAVVAVALISRFLQLLLSLGALPVYLKGRKTLRP